VIELPDKQYFKIGEVARLLGVKPSVLRFWETQFPSIQPKKTRSNHRLYTRRHVERVALIRELLYEQKFTIAGARRHLAGKRGAGGDGAETDAPAPSRADADRARARLERAEQAAQSAQSAARQATQSHDAAQTRQRKLLDKVRKEVRELLKLVSD